MLVACRLAGLSALETYYAGVSVGAQCGRDSRFGRIAGGSRREAAWRSRFRSGPAVILQIRRDPLYMERLITNIDNRALRGSARWRVLRAVRDTLPSYTLTDSGLFDLLERLENSIKSDRTSADTILTKGENLHMIAQIARRLKIDLNELFQRAGRRLPDLQQRLARAEARAR